MEYFKDRWAEMDWGRRAILLIHPALFLLFFIVFLTLGQQQVVSYQGQRLRYEPQGEAAVYSGRVHGSAVKYVVSPGQVVEYWLDGALDSTYTVAEDPTAIPDTEEAAQYGPDFYTGVEIRKGGEVWFRGASSSFWLVDEEGNNLSFSFGLSSAGGTARLKPPDPSTILRFAQGPEVNQRGEGMFLLLALFASLACLFSLWFEDHLFRWDLAFRVRNPQDAEPSEWELFSRWLSWILLTGLALFIYAMGSGLLQTF